MKSVFILILLAIAVAATANALECEEPGELFQNPEDCTSYIVCGEDKIASDPMKCGPGLRFDDVHKVCNWPKEVTCKSEKVINSTITDETANKSSKL